MASDVLWEDYLDEVLKDPAAAAGYLNACLENYDPAAFRLALLDVARARIGIHEFAETPAVNREHLDRMLSENEPPDLRSLEAMLDVLGFRLSITLKEVG